MPTASDAGNGCKSRENITINDKSIIMVHSSCFSKTTAVVDLKPIPGTQ